MTKTTSPLVQGMREQVDQTGELLQQIDLDAVGALVEKLYAAYQSRNRVFIFGNGGSGATASHFAEDLAKSTIASVDVSQRLRVQSLTDNTPFILALGNDWGYETVFREQLVTLAEAGDVAIGISGSGNSPNIVRAMEWARQNGVWTAGFTGFQGGRLKELADLVVHSAIDDMEIAENTHMVVVHLVVSGLRGMISRAAG